MPVQGAHSAQINVTDYEFRQDLQELTLITRDLWRCCV